ENQGTASAFVLNDTNAAVNKSFVVKSGGNEKLSINENGNIITNGTLTVDGASVFNNNISQTGASTFSTGTGNVTLNGNTTISGSKTFTVGTGASTLGGTLDVAGLASLNGGLTVPATKTLTSNGQSTFAPGVGEFVTFNNIDQGVGSTDALCTDASKNL